MRKGQNPAKMGLAAYQPKRLGMAILSYIPSQTGYFAQSLDVLRYQIASIYHSTKEFDLLVFDNGSCPEVQEELRHMQSDGFIHFLMLSQFNIGKAGALNWILAALPNEIIGFSDGDVLFRPGWLEKSLEIVQAFPTAGLVSVQPCIFDILKGEGQAHHTLEKDPTYRLYSRLPDPAVVEEYGHGVGLEYREIEAFKQQPVQVVEETRTGVNALIGQSHMQFIMPNAVARRIRPLPAAHALFRRETRKLNIYIDQLGLLQLTSLEAFVYHMGNKLDETTLDEIHRMNLNAILKSNPVNESIVSQAQVRPTKKRAMQVLIRLARIPFFKKTIQRLYNFLFEYFAQEK
jgi:glycosyltransferase involved in cell wall biosynthesis